MAKHGLRVKRNLNGTFDISISMSKVNGGKVSYIQGVLRESVKQCGILMRQELEKGNLVRGAKTPEQMTLFQEIARIKQETPQAASRQEVETNG